MEAQLLEDTQVRCKWYENVNKYRNDHGPATKLDEFLEKFQTAFDPPSHFWKIILQFYMTDMVAYAYMRGDMMAK